MIEIVIIIAIALILWLFLRKVPQIKNREVRASQKKPVFNWISIKRKTRAFFRGGYRNIIKLFLRKKKPRKKKRIRRVRVNIPKSYQKAKRLFQEGDLGRAERSCLRLITLRPAEARLYYLLFQIYQARENPKDAIMALKEALKREEDSFWMMELVQLYQDQEQFPKAEKAIKKAIKLNNTIAKRFAILAEIQLKLDKRREAEENIERALEMEPHNSGYQELKREIKR